jgi:hypothetical protein
VLRVDLFERATTHEHVAVANAPERDVWSLQLADV